MFNPEVTFRKFDLAGRTAFITGGNAGLGYYMARGLARTGARVMIASRNEDSLAVAGKQLSEESGGAEVFSTRLDLADTQSTAEAAKHALTELCGVDIFIGNAGLAAVKLIEDLDEDKMDKMHQVNVASNYFLVRQFLPHMREKEWGRVIFSSSMASVTGSATGMLAYAAQKSSLNAMARSIAAEAGHDGVTANSLIIGTFLTDMLQRTVANLDETRGEGSGAAFLANAGSIAALGRVGDPSEIEGAVQLLASDAGSYITGSEFRIDGGASMMLRPNIKTEKESVE